MKAKTKCFAHLLLLFYLTFIWRDVSGQPIVKYNSFISTGLSSPLEIANAGDGRLFIAEKGGTIKIWDGSTILGTPFLDISSIITTDGERGLLSLAFHPDYATNGYFFVYYTNLDGSIEISRYQVSADPNVANTTGTIFLTIPKLYSNHNGGHLQFRTEGSVHYLYFGTGDGGSGNDPDNNAQNTSSFLGKMLRVTADTVPPVSPVIWAIGLRNPFRWSFDRLTHDMWIGDVGQGAWEEVDFRANGTFGANYGWRCYEGLVPNPDITCNPEPVQVPPVFVYPNPNPGSSAITGGYVYRGTEFPAMYGYYITTDFYSGQVWILNPDGTVARTQTGLPVNIAGFGEAEDGELYAASLTGNIIYKLSASLPSPLPVTLLNFTVRNFTGYHEIRWKTAAEENIDKYIIEFSTEGSTYSTAAEITALNYAEHSYSYRHELTQNGKLFYRLKILDKTGEVKYSPVIIIGGVQKQEIKVYPTIITNNLLHVITNIDINSLIIYDIYGKEVLKNLLNGIQGYFTVTLPSLAKGTYIVVMKGNQLNRTEKIIKQ